MKARILSLAIALIALFSFTSAFAQNPHFLPNRPDNTYDAGLTLCSSGTLAGLGNYAGQNVQIQLVVEGVTSTQCATPNSQNVAPGQSSSATYTSPVALVPVNKQGKATYSICTNAPTVTNQTAGCPNDMWTASATDVVFTSGTAYLLINGERVDLIDQTF
jgi:hypothetical protein